MKYFSSDNIFQPVFFCCGNLISRDGFIHCRRTISCNVLIYVIKGTLNISVYGENYSVKSGEFIFLPKDIEHFGTEPSAGELSYMWIHFVTPNELDITEEKPTELSPEGCCLPIFSAVSNTERVHLLFSQILDISRQKSLYSDNMLSSMFCVLLMEISQCDRGEEKKLSPAVYTASEWINSHCCEDISPNDVALGVHYSVKYLSALFRRETGITLKEHINRSRIENASHILSDSSASVKEAAFSCGFSDEKYFMRLFKKYKSVTPSEYRSRFQ